MRRASRNVRAAGRWEAILFTAIVSVLGFTARFSPAQTPRDVTRWREFSYAKQTNRFDSRMAAVDGIQRTGYIVLNDGTFGRLWSSLVHTASLEGKEFYQGFIMYDFDDGSSILAKVDVSGEPRAKQTGTILFLSGTKRFKGISGRGTVASWMPAKWDLYTEVDASYSAAPE
ncbi:MAG TPA: hypothetical protein PKH24_04520 [Sedimentisphaerales bacterium]|jgi:hypothetical protein|nr:hypothetical protein [Sedimentisphaerales bacterium]HNU28674.1 hypothetical protein [Sedimentisphaerales bacterium]